MKNVNIRVACDVDNPLLGEKGASYVFGPQKGATPEIAKKLDKNLASFANIIENKLGKDIKNTRSRSSRWIRIWTYGIFKC